LALVALTLVFFGAYNSYPVWLMRNERPLIAFTEMVFSWGAFDSAKNHKHQRRKRQSVTAKREK